MYYGYLWFKMKRVINYASLVVHSIAHVTLFFNGLLMRVVSGICRFDRLLCKLVLVCINHVLTCNKADEQQP